MIWDYFGSDKTKNKKNILQSTKIDTSD